jgi:hypothetical protein
VRLASHDLAELDLLARLRAVDGPLPRGLQAEAARLLGGEGTGVAERLGLPADAAEDEQRTAALTAVLAWRDRADDPLAPRATVDACEVVARSVEGLLARLERAAGNPYGFSAGEPSPAGTGGAGGGSAGAGAQPGA